MIYLSVNIIIVDTNNYDIFSVNIIIVNTDSNYNLYFPISLKEKLK